MLQRRMPTVTVAREICKPTASRVSRPVSSSLGALSKAGGGPGALRPDRQLVRSEVHGVRPVRDPRGRYRGANAAVGGADLPDLRSCVPRDSSALSQSVEALGFSLKLFAVTLLANEDAFARAMNRLVQVAGTLLENRTNCWASAFRSEISDVRSYSAVGVGVRLTAQGDLVVPAALADEVKGATFDPVSEVYVGADGISPPNEVAAATQAPEDGRSSVPWSDPARRPALSECKSHCGRIRSSHNRSLRLPGCCFEGELRL